jgi:hypothetical protein
MHSTINDTQNHFSVEFSWKDEMDILDMKYFVYQHINTQIKINAKNELKICILISFFIVLFDCGMLKVDMLF